MPAQCVRTGHETSASLIHPGITLADCRINHAVISFYLFPRVYNFWPNALFNGFSEKITGREKEKIIERCIFF